MVSGDGERFSAAAPIGGKATDLAILALEHFRQAKSFLSEGDWAGYGRELDKLENILKQLSQSK